MNLWQIFYKGLFEQNPIFRLALSLCPALAVTSTVINALAMGLSVMFVITVNNVVVSLFRKVVNPKVRVPVYITSVATIVTVVQLMLEAFFPLIYKELSIYLALIVVFAIILTRAATANALSLAWISANSAGVTSNVLSSTMSLVITTKSQPICFKSSCRRGDAEAKISVISPPKKSVFQKHATLMP